MFCNVNPAAKMLYITVMLTLIADTKINNAVIMPKPHLICCTSLSKLGNQ